MFLVVANVQAKPGHSQALFSELRSYIARVLKAEPGTLYFEVYRDALNDNPDKEHFVILEGYRDEAAFQAHVAMPYREAAIQRIRTHLADGSAEQFQKIETDT